MYTCHKSLINTLEHDSFSAIKWFHNNYMELNGDKCYLLFARHLDESILAKILVEKIWKSYKQKLLGVQMINNNPLMSTVHVSNYELYKEAAHVRFMNSFKKAILSLFNIETSKVWPSYKVKENLPHEIMMNHIF